MHYIPTGLIHALIQWCVIQSRPAFWVSATTCLTSWHAPVCYCLLSKRQHLRNAHFKKKKKKKNLKKSKWQPHKEQVKAIFYSCLTMWTEKLNKLVNVAALVVKIRWFSKRMQGQSLCFYVRWSFRFNFFSSVCIQFSSASRTSSFTVDLPFLAELLLFENFIWSSFTTNS